MCQFQRCVPTRDVLKNLDVFHTLDVCDTQDVCHTRDVCHTPDVYHNLDEVLHNLDICHFPDYVYMYIVKQQNRRPERCTPKITPQNGTPKKLLHKMVRFLMIY